MLVEYLQSASRIRLCWVLHEKGGSSTWNVAGGKKSPVITESMSSSKLLLSMDLQCATTRCPNYGAIDDYSSLPMCHHDQCCRSSPCQYTVCIVIARRSLLAHIPQERLTNTIILSSVEEWVCLELVSQLLRECDMTFIIKASVTEYQDPVSVL